METTWKIALLLQPIIASFIISRLGGNRMDLTWYSKLEKPTLTPPKIVFPIAWTILYILLGVNAFLMYNTFFNFNRPSIFSSIFLHKYMIIYEIQLILNFSWSIFFFNLKKPWYSLAIVAIMIISTTYLLWESWNYNKIAFWVLVPYFIWICFASYLNFYIAKNN